MEDVDVKTEYGLVILLDVLGIKGIWRNQDPKAILNKWKIFTDAIENTLIQTGKTHRFVTSFHVFSDTIIMTITGELEKKIHDVSSILYSITHTGITLDLPMRGAISLGTFYQSKKMIIGPAIDECSQFYELADCFGVIVSPSYQSFLERISRDPITAEGINFDYVKSDIPIKDNKLLRNSFMLRIKGWAKSALLENKEHPDIKTLDDLLHYKLEHLTSVEASNKLKNTLELMKQNRHLEEKLKDVFKK